MAVTQKGALFVWGDVSWGTGGGGASSSGVGSTGREGGLGVLRVDLLSCEWIPRPVGIGEGVWEVSCGLHYAALISFRRV
jgi:hypothetical protein